MTSANKYAVAHENPQGPGDARPTAMDIIKDENIEGKLAGKTILITGASAGLGVETVRALALTGATIFAGARDLKKAEKALVGIKGKIELLKVDLASLASVRAAAEEFLQRSRGRLNILINNAGVMAIPIRTLTEDGLESQFATNHIGKSFLPCPILPLLTSPKGHFLLFQLLKPALLSASTPSFHSRVVILASSGHKMGGIRPDDYNFTDGTYNDYVAYGQAKTANIYMSNAIERYYGAMGLHAVAVHPGIIMTELTRHMDESVTRAIRSDPMIANITKSVEQGAATTVLAAIGKRYEGIGGKYLEDLGEWDFEGTNGPYEHGYASWAFNPALEDKLWKDSNLLIGFEEK
jgi:NAD(P)-dependent dehydrogenase (short-subunit alcohol dehydrogenase family)